jgi:glycosyltransferase involved in cell wall biosynthesis
MGGAEHSLLDILEAASRTAEVFLATSEKGVLVDRARDCGAAVSIIPCSSSVNAIRRGGLIVSALLTMPGVFSFFRYVLSIRKLVKEIRPDLIHANIPKSHVALFLLARLGYKGRCCFHIREIFERKSTPFRLYSLLFPARNAFVLAISKAVQSHLPPVLRQASRVIYNGVAIPPHAPRRPAVSHAPRFVYLGRVVPWKGCHTLIEAFAMLSRNAASDGSTLDIIGDTMYWDASYRRNLESQISRSGCADKVRLLPHTAKPIEALCRYDVFCIASENEPFGRVVAEAMACGLPVAGFATGGLPELVEHGKTGILVPQNDCAALAAAMRVFIDKRKTIGAMGAAARNRAEKLFDKNLQVEKIVDVLEEEARGRY